MFAEGLCTACQPAQGLARLLIDFPISRAGLLFLWQRLPHAVLRWGLSPVPCQGKPGSQERSGGHLLLIQSPCMDRASSICYR